MVTPAVDPRRIQEVLEQYKRIKAMHPEYGNKRIAPLIGVSDPTLRRYLSQYGGRSGAVGPFGTEAVVPEAPAQGETVEELIARKKTLMERALKVEEWSKLIPVEVKDRSPIGLLLVGDPHVDDDHCDIARLEDDLTTVGRHKGFFAGHIGDLTNNWVGRLARLYANQSTTFGDGIRLAEWMLNLCPNLFVVNGNHDVWNNGGDLLRWIVRAGVHNDHGARLALRWPGGQEVRIHARHQFPGKSQFSELHGMRRELLWGHRDHILACGHHHTSEAGIQPGPDGSVHWLFRVEGYKRIDGFAKEHHFPERRLAPSVALVIRPEVTVEAERIKPFWDTREAADYLRWARKRVPA